ncbi:MAG: hypothetical protein HQK66_14630 [Desulfamplus sp.]|nr:hypothetical protein [Desulfamplus sp.]
MSSNYWSGTTNANNTDNAWIINFNNGNDNNNNKSSSYYVRAVRAGKCSLLSFESLYNAYMDCRKRKGNTINALRFQYAQISELVDLALALQKGTYQPSRSVCFLTSSPKLREVFAADFRDRVVHHLVVRELEKIFEPCFIHDSYACRKGKGIHGAVNRLRSFMKKATCSGKKRAWYMQLDIRSFFMSVDKNILFQLLAKKLKPLALDDPARGPDHLKNEILLSLCGILLDHDCTENYLFKGDPSRIHHVPKHKSLFHTEKHKGMPIGNLTSQFFANLYLNELDQFVKHTLRCRWYIRYVDDFVLIHNDRSQLEKWRCEIIDFLNEKLHLSLKDSGRIARVAEGVNFLGYITRPDYRLVRNRVVNNLKFKLDLFKKKIVHEKGYGDRRVNILDLKTDVLTHLRQTLASYLGHFKHANSWQLMHAIFEKHNWLNFIFILDPFNCKLIEKLKYKGCFRSYKAQVIFFKFRFGDGWLHLFRAGRFFEAYGDDALKLQEAFGYRLKNHRKGLNPCTGFPCHLQDLAMPKIIRAGFNVVMMEEEDKGRYVMNRRVSYIIQHYGAL